MNLKSDLYGVPLQRAGRFRTCVGAGAASLAGVRAGSWAARIGPRAVPREGSPRKAGTGQRPPAAVIFLSASAARSGSGRADGAARAGRQAVAPGVGRAQLPHVGHPSGPFRAALKEVQGVCTGGVRGL